MTKLFEHSCRSGFDEAGNIFDRRGVQGFVRHCHGDLHLRNICLVDGKPTLFDAIEFGDDISHIDVLFDLAFLVMDLEHRGLRGEANIVFNRYLYRTGDVDDLSIFPLYQALRAGIRAHVSAMAAATQENSEDREKLQQDANSYLRLGLKQFERTSPQLIAIGGVSGSGKSTIAREIAPHLGPAPGALVLSSDLIRKKILGVEPLTKLTDAAYNSETDQAVYGELMNVAKRVLVSGYTVVLDATFIDQAQRQKLKTIARQAGVRFKGFWLEANAAALRERLLRRVSDPSDATISVLEHQLEKDVGEFSWQRIDATQSCKAIRAAICRAANAGGIPPRRHGRR
jgi:predicted kinase